MSLGKPKLGPLSIQTPFGASCSRGGAMGQRVSQPSGGALRGGGVVGDLLQEGSRELRELECSGPASEGALGLPQARRHSNCVAS